MIGNTKTEENGYRNLIAWQVGDKLAWKVYLLTDKLPGHEIYGLTSQLRRAVLSVPLNIVEGYARNNRNEFRNFLRISLGSLAETGYLLEFALKRKHLTEPEYKEVIGLKERCGKLLWKLMKSQ